MKPPSVSVLFAATCFMFGCSSTPLDPAGDLGTGTASKPGKEAATTGPTSTFADYPAGPYGSAKGATIENLSFLGWRHPDAAGYDTSKFETVRLSDFYDPDGHTGIKLLAINASAVWCGVCRGEYEDMNATQIYATFHAKGVEILGTLFEDNAFSPAQPQDLKNWGALSTHAVKFPLVLDPGFKMGAYFDSDATPLNLLVDVRTMKIVSVTMGYVPAYWAQVQTQLDRP